MKYQSQVKIMINEFWLMDGYNIYIWPSYILTLSSLVYLTISSIYLSKKAKNLLKKLEELES